MESTTSEYKESKEQLQSCLVDLFQAPTKGIDEAFTLILGLMKSQEEKNQESWLQIEQRNNELVQKLSECQESNNVMKIEFGSQIDDMQNLITSLKKERDDLLKQNEDIIVKQSSLEKQIVEMNEEVKVRLFHKPLRWVISRSVKLINFIFGSVLYVDNGTQFTT